MSDDELNNPRRYDWTKGRPMLDIIAENSYEHDAEHAAQIEAYRKAKT
jgi:hypothetical protein